MDEWEEIQRTINAVLDEVETYGHQRQYRPLETTTENALDLLYIGSIAKPIIRCKDKATGAFHRQLVRQSIEKLIAEKAQKHSFFVFNLVDILKRERALEHLKYSLITGSLYLRRTKHP